MKLKLSIKGKKEIITCIEGHGHLGAHLNIHNHRKEEKPPSVFVSGHDTNDESVTKHYNWAERELKIGDKVEIEVLTDSGNEESDEPDKTYLSSDERYTLLENANLAKELKGMILDFEKNLFYMFDNVKDCESEDELKKYKRSLGKILMSNAENILYPLYRKHSDLIPDELRGKSL
jgi:hypothetical protein